MPFAINSTNTGWRSVGSTADLLQGETFVDGDAEPVLVPDPKAAIRAQISALENSITPRRLREAILGDTSFVPGVNARIVALRAQL